MPKKRTRIPASYNELERACYLRGFRDAQARKAPSDYSRYGLAAQLAYLCGGLDGTP